MPTHVVAGHLAIMIAPMAALLALVYAASARSRRVLRWPLLTATTLTVVLTIWAGESGGALLGQITATGPAAEAAAATAHAHGSDTLTVAAAVLLMLVLSLVWWLLRPGRRAGQSPGVPAVLGAVVLGLSALAVLATTTTTLVAALTAVWGQPAA